MDSIVPVVVLDEPKKQKRSAKKKLPGSTTGFVEGDQVASVARDSNIVVKLNKLEPNTVVAGREISVSADLVEYASKLEYEVLKAQLKLRAERKAHAQLLSSLALFFDSKGVSAEKVKDFVDSVVDQLKDEYEDHSDQPSIDWKTYLKDKQLDEQENVKMKLFDVTQIGGIQDQNQNSQPQNQSVASSNSGNIIRLQMNNDEKLSTTKQLSAFVQKKQIQEKQELQNDEGKIKKRRKNNHSLNDTINAAAASVTVTIPSQVTNGYQTQRNDHNQSNSQGIYGGLMPQLQQQQPNRQLVQSYVAFPQQNGVSHTMNSQVLQQLFTGIQQPYQGGVNGNGRQ